MIILSQNPDTQLSKVAESGCRVDAELARYSSPDTAYEHDGPKQSVQEYLCHT